MTSENNNHRRNNSLIVLRGPSGSGKTTTAKHLFERANRQTVIIHQDYYRFIFKPAGGGSKKNGPVIHEMIEHNVTTALAHGYNVILEGMLTLQAYGEILKRISNQHSGPKSFYLFNIGLDETVRRNTSRLKQARFTAEDMKEWYPSSIKPTGLPNERIIHEEQSLEEVIEYVISTSGF